MRNSKPGWIFRLLTPQRWWAAISLLLASIPGVAVAEFTLWTGDPLPTNPADLPLVPGVTHSLFHVVDDPTDPDNDQFFHGAAIIEHQGVFYTSFANSAVDENSASERLRGRKSYDNGLTWSSVEVMAPDPDGPLGPDRRSHGSFFSLDGQLWAFPSRFGTGSVGTFPNLTLEAVRLQSDGTWENMGLLAPNTWSLDTPTQMANGKWIMGGVDSNFRATVVMSSGPRMTDADDNLLPWTTVQLPLGGKAYSETSVIVDGNHVMAIMRNASEPTAAVSVSTDGGETWSLAEPSNFPMTTSKPYAGTLSTGQRYLISNMGNNRRNLTIAVSDPFEETFSKVWRVTDRPPPPIEYPGYAKGPQWSYPYAHEHDGNLYIVYSDGKERGAMAVVPVSSLAIGPPAGQLRLLVDRRTGEARIVNPMGEAPLEIDGYLLTSSSGLLNPTGWNSLESRGLSDWRESNPTSNHLGELNLAGSLPLGSHAAHDLGSVYSFQPTTLGESIEDVKFEYHVAGGQTFSGRVEYTGLHNQLVLLVDPETGQVALQNQSHFDLRLDGYLITSASGALSPNEWTSFQAAGQSGWRESNPSSNHLGELNLDGERFLPGEGERISLGTAFVPTAQEDLIFGYRLAGGETMFGIVEYLSLAAMMGDYNRDGVVDLADYTVWRNSLGQTGTDLAADGNGDLVVDIADYTLWKSNFGHAVGGATLTSSVQSVPEPAMPLLLATTALVIGRRCLNSRTWRTRSGTNQ